MCWEWFEQCGPVPMVSRVLDCDTQVVLDGESCVRLGSGASYAARGGAAKSEAQ